MDADAPMIDRPDPQATERLLLDCVRATPDRDRIRATLDRPDFEWAAFWRLAAAQHVQPLVARTLADATDLGAEHISPYQLTIEPEVAFGRAVRRGLFTPPDEDAGTALYDTTGEVLEAAELPGREDVGALRLRLVATKNRPCNEYPLKQGDQYAEGVILDFDYWTLLPR